MKQMAVVTWFTVRSRPPCRTTSSRGGARLRLCASGEPYSHLTLKPKSTDAPPLSRTDPMVCSSETQVASMISSGVTHDQTLAGRCLLATRAGGIVLARVLPASPGVGSRIFSALATFFAFHVISESVASSVSLDDARQKLTTWTDAT